MPGESVTEVAAVARVRVMAGAAPHETKFRLGRPSRLVIGSDPAATLCIERADVAPRQLDVIWDGAQLWVQDALRLGRTFVNGQTLNEWRVVVGHAMVVFGGVRLWLSAETAEPRLPSPDFAALDRARLMDLHHSARLRLKDTGRFTLPPELLAEVSERDAP